MINDENRQAMIYQALKEKIFGWELQPGEKINISKLSNEMNISTIPLREVLSRLLVEKLVVFEQNKGYRVSNPLTEDEMRQLAQTRILLESASIRTIIQMNKTDVASRLTKITETMAKIDTTDSYSNILKFVQADEQFHRTIMEESENSFMLDAHARLYSHLHIARFYHVRGSVDQTEAVKEHIEIIEAIQTRDVFSAVEAITNHRSILIWRTLMNRALHDIEYSFRLYCFPINLLYCPILLINVSYREPSASSFALPHYQRPDS